MRCTRCKREISENQSYVHQGRVLCEDCLMDIGLSAKECDPWATYIDKSVQLRKGLKGADGLSDMQKKVYELVKDRGRTTRDEVIKELGISEVDLNTQLGPLMHGDLIKERSEKGTMYLIITSSQ